MFGTLKPLKCSMKWILLLADNTDGDMNCLPIECLVESEHIIIFIIPYILSYLNNLQLMWSFFDRQFIHQTRKMHADIVCVCAYFSTLNFKIVSDFYSKRLVGCSSNDFKLLNAKYLYMNFKYLYLTCDYAHCTVLNQLQMLLAEPRNGLLGLRTTRMARSKLFYSIYNKRVPYNLPLGKEILVPWVDHIGALKYLSALYQGEPNS